MALNARGELPARNEKGHFLKGYTGNYNGKPKTAGIVREFLKAHTLEAAEELVKYIHHPNPKIAMWAITEIINRVCGKPDSMTRVELDGSLSVNTLADLVKRECEVAKLA